MTIVHIYRGGSTTNGRLSIVRSRAIIRSRCVAKQIVGGGGRTRQAAVSQRLSRLALVNIGTLIHVTASW